jgi:hypothetical protein
MNGMTFLRVLLVATAPLVLAGFAPPRIAGMLLGWAIVAGAAWWFVQASAERIAAMSDPAGYSIAMGALLGVSLRLTATFARIAYDAALAHEAPRFAGGWSVLAIVIALVAAALMGGIGGFAGGLKIARDQHAPLTTAWIAGGVVALLALVGAAIVAYVVALANAMSDVPR